MASRKPEDDLQAKAEEAIEQTAERVRGAADDYFSFLERTILSCPTGGTELGEKLKSCAEENIAAIRDYVHNLGQAKDFQEVIRIQAGFMQSQFSALVEQTRTLGEACVRTAAVAANNPFKKAA
jgi:hypothetical protein